MWINRKTPDCCRSTTNCSTFDRAFFSIKEASEKRTCNCPCYSGLADTTRILWLLWIVTLTCLIITAILLHGSATCNHADSQHGGNYSSHSDRLHINYSPLVNYGTTYLIVVSCCRSWRSRSRICCDKLSILGLFGSILRALSRYVRAASNFRCPKEISASRRNAWAISPFGLTAVSCFGRRDSIGAATTIGEGRT